MHGFDPESDPVERLGGAAGIARLADEVYAEALLDDRLAQCFCGHSVGRLVERQQQFLLGLLSTPQQVDDFDLAAAHAPLVARGLHDGHVDALLDLFERALEAIGADEWVSRLLLERLEQFRQEVLGGSASPGDARRHNGDIRQEELE
jgi:truncated hemoglobin YjbI